MSDDANTLDTAAPDLGTPAGNEAGAVESQGSEANVQPAPGEGTPGERAYAGKYRSVEDLERAYKEAERKLHENAQSRKSPSQMAQTIFGGGQQAQAQQAPPQAAQQLAQGAQQAYAQGGQQGADAFWAQYGYTPAQGQLMLSAVEHMTEQRMQGFMQNQLAPLTGVLFGLQAQTAIQDLQRQFTDFDEYDDQISSLLKSDAEFATLVKRNPRKWLETAYKTLRANDSDRKAKEATAAARVGATTAEQQRQQSKGAAAVEPPGSRAAPSRERTSNDDEMDSLFGKKRR